MLQFLLICTLYALDAVSAQSCSFTSKYAFGGDTSCTMYLQCIEGQVQKLTCDTGLVFYQEMQQCVLADSYNCGGTQPPCPQPNGDFPYTTDSTRYLHCTNGNSLIRDCPAGNVFDPSCSMCTSQDGSMPCQSDSNPENTYQCPSSDGNYPDPSDGTCTNYYVCSNGQGTLTQCQQNMLFYPGLSQCVLPDSYTCGGWSYACPAANGDFADPENPTYYYYCMNGYPLRRYCTDGQVFSTDLQTCSTSVTSTVSTPQCSPGQSGNSPNPADSTCQTYYLCQDNQQVQTTCPSNFVYYPCLQKCVLPDSYDCGNPNQFVCPQPDKDFPDPNDNTRFYYCMGSCPLHRTCPEGQMYNGDPNVMSCQ